MAVPIPQPKPLNRMTIGSNEMAHPQESRARGEKRRQDGQGTPKPAGPSNNMGAIRAGDAKKRQGDHRGFKSPNRYLKEESMHAVIAVGNKKAGPKDLANFVNVCKILHTCDINFKSLVAQDFARNCSNWGGEQDQVLKKALFIFQKVHGGRARCQERDWTMPLFRELNELVGLVPKGTKMAGTVNEPGKSGEQGKENQRPQGVRQMGGNSPPQKHGLPHKMGQPGARSSPTRGSTAGPSSSGNPSLANRSGSHHFDTHFDSHFDCGVSSQKQPSRVMASRPAPPASSKARGARPM